MRCQHRRCGGTGQAITDRVWVARFLVRTSATELRVCEGCRDLLLRDGWSVVEELPLRDQVLETTAKEEVTRQYRERREIRRGEIARSLMIGQLHACVCAPCGIVLLGLTERRAKRCFGCDSPYHKLVANSFGDLQRQITEMAGDTHRAASLGQTTAVEFGHLVESVLKEEANARRKWMKQNASTPTPVRSPAGPRIEAPPATPPSLPWREGGTSHAASKPVRPPHRKGLNTPRFLTSPPSPPRQPPVPELDRLIGVLRSAGYDAVVCVDVHGSHTLSANGVVVAASPSRVHLTNHVRTWMREAELVR